MVQLVIDPTLPRSTFVRALYVFKVMASRLDWPVNITDEIATVDEGLETYYTVVYGRLPSPLRTKNTHLYIPYEEDFLSTPPAFRIDIEGIPVLYARKSPEFLVENGCLGFDLVQLIFFLLSGTEEYTSNKYDHLGRHEENTSISFRHSLVEVPLVSQYIEVVRREIAKTIPVECHPIVPQGGYRFALALTHDVDYTSQYSAREGLQFIRYGMLQPTIYEKIRAVGIGIYLSINSPWKYVFKNDNYWVFDSWFTLEEQLGVRSTFLVFPPKVGRLNFYDRVYSYGGRIQYFGKWWKIGDIFRHIHQNGWEIGLHATCETFVDATEMKRQKTSLERELGAEVRSVRQHTLRFRNDLTWKAHETSGFNCDSTLGYNKQVGFRYGASFPFHPFSLSENRELQLWEVPLVIQDKGLFQEGALCTDEALARALLILEAIRDTGGAGAILWHTNVASERVRPGWLHVYEEIIRWAQKEGAFVGPLHGVINWWNRRANRITISVSQARL